MRLEENDCFRYMKCFKSTRFPSKCSSCVLIKEINFMTIKMSIFYFINVNKRKQWNLLSMIFQYCITWIINFSFLVIFKIIERNSYSFKRIVFLNTRNEIFRIYHFLIPIWLYYSHWLLRHRLSAYDPSKLTARGEKQLSVLR